MKILLTSDDLGAVKSFLAASGQYLHANLSAVALAKVETLCEVRNQTTHILLVNMAAFLRVTRKDYVPLS